jgi:hypothetical protein
MTTYSVCTCAWAPPDTLQVFRGILAALMFALGGLWIADATKAAAGNARLVSACVDAVPLPSCAGYLGVVRPNVSGWSACVQGAPSCTDWAAPGACPAPQALVTFDSASGALACHVNWEGSAALAGVSLALALLLSGAFVSGCVSCLARQAERRALLRQVCAGAQL